MTNPDLSEVSPEQLGSVKVHSASKHLRAEGDAPSSFTVITADEIREPVPRTGKPSTSSKACGYKCFDSGRIEGFVEKGGILNFALKDDLVRFQVNHGAG